MNSIFPSSRSALLRTLITATVLVALVAGSGCSWFRKGKELYAEDPAQRPLEVPPPLPDTAAAGAAPADGSVTASSATPARPAAASSSGFNVDGSRDEVFARVGEALEAIEGVTISSRAQLLGAYDISYQGSNFLVRVSESGGGAYVSAVDPRGVPASGVAPAQLIEALKTRLGG